MIELVGDCVDPLAGKRPASKIDEAEVSASRGWSRETEENGIVSSGSVGTPMSVIRNVPARHGWRSRGKGKTTRGGRAATQLRIRPRFPRLEPEATDDWREWGSKPPRSASSPAA